MSDNNLYYFSLDEHITPLEVRYDSECDRGVQFTKDEDGKPLIKFCFTHTEKKAQINIVFNKELNVWVEINGQYIDASLGTIAFACHAPIYAGRFIEYNNKINLRAIINCIAILLPEDIYMYFRCFEDGSEDLESTRKYDCKEAIRHCYWAFFRHDPDLEKCLAYIVDTIKFHNRIWRLPEEADKRV